MKRPYDQGNYYKRKHLLVVCLQAQRLAYSYYSYSYCGEHGGRPGAGEVAESYTLIQRQRERDCACHGLLEPNPGDTLPLTMSHLPVL